MKKRFLLMAIAVMSAVVMICMTSCGGTDANVTDDGDNSADASAGTQIRMLDVEEDPYCVMPGDCDSRGYLGLICDDTEEYVFTAVNSDKTELEWEVYVMDSKYPDATRYIEESETPALTGDGTLKLKEGQYIYIHCSANSFTSEDGSLPTDAYLQIDSTDTDD
ncbi:MAG: hypothetical protein PUI82_02870 [Firmicutes bacterium]|nr:hypothetical protein [Bacillota bacterium]MDD7015948.1 hypothetical protein [Bacillota bacterium]MDY4959846.1 hypothetical protein [Lentihominibacter sp.]